VISLNFNPLLDAHFSIRYVDQPVRRRQVELNAIADCQRLQVHKLDQKECLESVEMPWDHQICKVAKAYNKARMTVCSLRIHVKCALNIKFSTTQQLSTSSFEDIRIYNVHMNTLSTTLDLFSVFFGEP
jgi:hypothetical protein